MTTNDLNKTSFQARKKKDIARILEKMMSVKPHDYELASAIYEVE